MAISRSRERTWEPESTPRAAALVSIVFGLSAKYHTVAFLPTDGSAIPEDIQDAWERLDARNTHVYAMYQSLRWWEHLQATGQGSSSRLAIVRDENSRLVGVVPIRIGDYPLEFAAGRRFGLQLPVRTAFILGGEPSIPPGSALRDQLFRSIWDQMPEVEAIYLKGIPAAGQCWKDLRRGCSQAIVYAERGIRDLYTLTLPPTFEEYLAKFRQKKRYNLRRQVKLLRDAGGGALELSRVESVADISRFLRNAQCAAQHSWQHGLLPKDKDAWDQPARVEDLARRGFLRSYLLSAGGTPCAYVNGYQLQGVFHYADVGYDERFAAHSPGSVLLLLLIEDLIAHRSPRVMNFGIGDSQYKRQFATDRLREASVLLLKRTLANRVRYAAHRACRGLVRQVRHEQAGGRAADATAVPGLEVLTEE